MSSKNIIAFVLALLGSAPAVAADSPDGAYVSYLRPYNGRADCTDETIEATVSPTADKVTLRFDQLAVPAGHRLESCALDLQFAYPEGWSYALESTTVRGFARF